MNEITRQLTKVILLNTKEQYMKERSTHAGNVTIRYLSLGVSLNTSVQYMKGKSTHAGNATTRQLQRIISLDISKHYMKGKHVLALNVIHGFIQIHHDENNHIEKMRAGSRCSRQKEKNRISM